MRFRSFLSIAILLLPFTLAGQQSSIASSSAPIRFVDVAKIAGIDFVTNSSPTLDRNSSGQVSPTSGHMPNTGQDNTLEIMRVSRTALLSALDNRKRRLLPGRY
jgi:hypothetical protein